MKEVFADSLNVDQADLNFDTLTYRGIPEWDSVAHMTLIAEIEDAFDIMIDTQDVIDMSSFAVAQTIVAKYGVEI
ncbi:acyl carrier protein [Micrococcales bacterium 31B]|nr:acyl carrier protein [Micrococcales bacterium 31B]